MHMNRKVNSLPAPTGMLAEEVYLLDGITCVEIESFVSLQGHPTVMAGLRALSCLEKEMKYLLLDQLQARRWIFIPGGTKQLIARNKYVREMSKTLSWSGRTILSLRGHKCSTPLVMPQGP